MAGSAADQNHSRVSWDNEVELHDSGTAPTEGIPKPFGNALFKSPEPAADLNADEPPLVQIDFDDNRNEVEYWE